MKTHLFLMPFLILVSACSDSRDVMEELPNSSIAGAPRETMTETQIGSALERPVTIGEDGPRLDACGGVGVVRGLGAGRTLALLAAPFQNAQPVAELANGTQVHVCTRSLDQRWMGVVVMSAAEPASSTTSPSNGTAGSVREDCGVSSPVDRRQPYEGPCPSGWVSSSFVQLIAG